MHCTASEDAFLRWFSGIFFAPVTPETHLVRLGKLRRGVPWSLVADGSVPCNTIFHWMDDKEAGIGLVF